MPVAARDGKTIMDINLFSVSRLVGMQAMSAQECELISDAYVVFPPGESETIEARLLKKNRFL